MVARGPGAVGCAHCTLLGAVEPCAVCKRLVCPACAADWATCAEPSGRVLRLGIGARLRDIDPAGQLGLVSRWHGALAALDLRRLRWVTPGGMPSRWSGAAIGFPIRLAGGQLIDCWLTSARELQFHGLSIISLATGEAARLSITSLATGEAARHDAPPPMLGTAVTGTSSGAAGDHYWYVTDTQRVAVMSPAPGLPGTAGAVTLPGSRSGAAPGIASYDPLPRKVIQAAHLDAERDVLAAGTWGEIVVDRIVDGKLARLDRVQTAGTIRWLELAGPWLAACIERDGAAELIVWRLETDLSVGPVAVRTPLPHGLHGASLSRDGRYLAVGSGVELSVRALDTGTVSSFGEHTDRIGQVRFVGDDHLLVTADLDNRVVLRPRTATGYAQAVMPVEVPDAPVVPVVPGPVR